MKLWAYVGLFGCILLLTTTFLVIPMALLTDLRLLILPGVPFWLTGAICLGYGYHKLQIHGRNRVK